MTDTPQGGPEPIALQTLLEEIACGEGDGPRNAARLLARRLEALEIAADWRGGMRLVPSDPLRSIPEAGPPFEDRPTITIARIADVVAAGIEPQPDPKPERLRWNTVVCDGVTWICRGEHERHDGCKWEREDAIDPKPEAGRECKDCDGTGLISEKVDHVSVLCATCCGTGGEKPKLEDWQEQPKPEQTYPCDECGKLRTKAQGGTTFTVCDACWDKAHPKPDETATMKTLHWTGDGKGTAFAFGFGTVRACIDCGVLIAGGPTRCVACVRVLEAAPKPDAATEGQKVTWESLYVYSRELCEAVTSQETATAARAARALLAERDAAQAALAEERKRVENLRAALRSCACALHNGSDIAPTASDDFHLGVPTEIAAYRRRMDDKLKWYEGIAAERDAARAEVERVRNELEHAKARDDVVVHMVKRLEEERDAARAEVAEAERQLRGFQSSEDRLAELLEGEPESKAPAPLVSRVETYVERLRAQLEDAEGACSDWARSVASLEARVRELEAERRALRAAHEATLYAERELAGSAAKSASRAADLERRLAAAEKLIVLFTLVMRAYDDGSLFDADAVRDALAAWEAARAGEKPAKTEG